MIAKTKSKTETLFVKLKHGTEKITMQEDQKHIFNLVCPYNIYGHQL